MLHGRGIGNFNQGDQAFMTETYEKKRKKGLRDKTKLTDAEILYYEISGSQGGGRTLETTYEVKQFPFPVDATVRRRETIDVRKVKPEIGEMSD